MNEWIPVSQKMPKENSKVIVLKENGDFDVCTTYAMETVEGTRKVFFANVKDTFKITHWMIPGLPK